MQYPNDSRRCLTVLDQDSTLIAVIEMSLSSWLVAGIVPGIERQPLKKLEADKHALLKLLHRWRDEAVKAPSTRLARAGGRRLFRPQDHLTQIKAARAKVLTVGLPNRGGNPVDQDQLTVFQLLAIVVLEPLRMSCKRSDAYSSHEPQYHTEAGFAAM